ncbi:MAG: hypothetical protein PHQ76_00010 [Caldisericia bacterium]|nr:hypothetical protein [Caldisericia bacterium]
MAEKISVELIQKSYVKGDFEDFITIKFRLTNKTEKDIKGIKGTIIFYDIFDSEIYRTTLSYDEGISKNSSEVWTGSIAYNQFMEEHQKLKNTELENLKLKWEPSVIIYQDGSKEPE